MFLFSVKLANFYLFWLWSQGDNHFITSATKYENFSYFVALSSGKIWHSIQYSGGLNTNWFRFWTVQSCSNDKSTDFDGEKHDTHLFFNGRDHSKKDHPKTKLKHLALKCIRYLNVQYSSPHCKPMFIPTQIISY